MSQPLPHYDLDTLDWRAAMRSNDRKACFLFVVFFIIYLLFGLIFDVAYYLIYLPNVLIPDLVYQLITLQLFPKMTLIMLGLAVLSLYLTYSLFRYFILSGTIHKEIKPFTKNNIHEQTLYNIVDEMTIAADLNHRPDVYVIEEEFMNAFAYGYDSDTAILVATRGLIEKLNRDELAAVIAHEICSIKDMSIRLMSVASLLANLMLIIIDMLWRSIANIYKTIGIYSPSSSNPTKGDSAEFAIMWVTLIIAIYFMPFVIVIVSMNLFLPPINIILLRYLNRTSAYFADASAVRLVRNNEPLISALLKIQNDYAVNEVIYTGTYNDTFSEKTRDDAYFYYPEQANTHISNQIANFFLSYPTINDRITALGGKRVEE